MLQILKPGEQKLHYTASSHTEYSRSCFDSDDFIRVTVLGLSRTTSRWNIEKGINYFLLSVLNYSAVEDT
jgi:hypothetical protein